MLGKSATTRGGDGRGLGYDYLHVAIDDHSRYAYVEVHPDERGTSCAGFVMRTAEHFASLGVRIEQIMTDQAKNYTLSTVFAQALERVGARHLVTRPYRPQTNGKAERFNRTMLERVGLCEALPLERGQASGSPPLARDLQSPASPHRARRASADLAAVNNVNGNYS